jgi:hypothetical protein
MVMVYQLLLEFCVPKKAENVCEEETLYSALQAVVLRQKISKKDKQSQHRLEQTLVVLGV